MERLVVLGVLTVAAVVVALVLQRRRPEAPSAPSYRAPTQVDLDDFARSEATTLVTVFTSATCTSCAAVWKTVEGLASAAVTVQRIEVQQSPALHERYKIDGVPTTLVIDGQGVVQQSYFGPVDEETLQAALV